MTLRLASPLFMLAAAGILLACQLPPAQNTSTAAAVVPPYDTTTERVDELESALADALIQIERLQAEQADQQTLSDIPPDANENSCYAKLLVPAQYVNRSERRIVKEASERIEMLPAKLGWVTERVMVSEEYVTLKVVPATYKWVEERTQVLPERRRQVMVSPAKYKTVVEKVVDTPEQQVWRPGRGERERVDDETGQIVHLATIPATYRNITKQVLVAEPTYRTEVIPAVFETVSKRVVDTPEHTVEEVQPAVYKSVRVKKVLEPERQVRHVEPPEYKTFHYKEKVADAKLDWREIPCKPTLTEGLVRALQKALSAAGFDAGYADGVWGRRTEQAVAAYQKDKGLATGRLSMEAMHSLGIFPTVE